MGRIDQDSVFVLVEGTTFVICLIDLHSVSTKAVCFGSKKRQIKTCRD